MANTKEYKIVINGLQESINAVESLNKQLDSLEQRINALQAKNVSIGTGSKGTSKSSLSEEEKLARQIEQIDAKREAFSKKIYQNYLAAKDVLKETVKDQQQIAASERLQANVYSNTMKGLKDKLADIKNVMQTTEIGSDLFKKYTAEANEITNKLKELEEAYGQFGRNVGNYKSATEEFKKLEITVNGVTRTFNNAREAYRALKNERDTMALMGQRETKQFKELDETVKTLASDIKDMSKSSVTMDNILDTMESFTAMAGIGAGFSQLFGFDDEVFNDSMKKLTSLLLIVKSFETLAKQWQSNEGLMGKLFKPMSEKIDTAFEDMAVNAARKFTKKLTEELSSFDDKTFETWINSTFSNGISGSDWLFGDIAASREFWGSTQEEIDNLKDEWNSLSIEEKKAMYTSELYHARERDAIERTLPKYKALGNVIKYLSKTLLTLGGIFATFLTSELLDKLTDFVKSLNTAKIAADAAESSVKALTRAFVQQRDILGASYLKGEITAMEYLNSLHEKQSALLAREVEQLKELSKANEYNGLFGSRYMSDKNTQFSGKKFEPTTVGAGTLSSIIAPWTNDLKVSVNSIEEVEKAWKHCAKAVREEKDAFDDGSGILSRSWWGSLVTSVKDTEKVMIGMGNIRLSDFINQFGELNRQLKNTEITTDEYAKELAKLKKEMDGNDVLNSVIANLDKYIPDEKVRNAVQNIINELIRLDDAFNMTTAQQVHHWNQVRIDAMKDGLNKTLEQIKENERYEIQQEAKTQEQRQLIEAKYARQRQDAREKAAKENLQKTKDEAKKLQDAENQLIAIRIENMKAGFEKRMAELNNQHRLELQKLANDAKDNKYIKVQEMTLEINKKYDRLILEEKRKWAFEVLKVYEDLAARIDQLNSATMETEASTATQNVQTRQRRGEQSTGYSMITPTSYDNSKALEQYYAKVVQIKKEAADKELEIEKERLAKAKEYEEKEEELRHSRLINEDGGEYIQQLRAGLISQEKYDELIEKENDAHYAKMNAIDKQYKSNLEATTQDTLEKEQKLYSDYYGNIINDLRSDKAKIDEIMSKQPVTDKQGWGVVNTSKTNQNYTKALEEYDKIKQEIVKKQQQLSADLQAHRISPEDFAIRQKDLDQEMKAIDKAVEGVKERQKMLIAEFIQSIQQYLQAAMESFNTIMNAVWDAQDAAFDREQDEIDKANEALDKKLDEQQEIVERHKSAIESIEDELATARGDRRQHLIDQLNEEIAAQRAAAAQEKQIQKQKEAMQKKQDALELKRKKAQYKRDMLQAIVNGAMAVTYAAINAWPIPAVPMMALAAATTAAQIAIMANNKPYAKGGMLEGKSHAQGGIPIPGTGIEVEGQEYVIRKKTSTKNVDLLDYINKSERKLSLDDFIDFYGGKVKRNVSSMNPSKRFATGGVIPSISSDITVGDKILSALEAYNDRDVVVSVVDINSRQNQVKSVQVMAGLTE